MSGWVLPFHQPTGAIAYGIVAVGEAAVFRRDFLQVAEGIVFVHFVVVGAIHYALGADLVVGIVFVVHTQGGIIAVDHGAAVSRLVAPHSLTKTHQLG